MSPLMTSQKERILFKMEKQKFVFLLVNVGWNTAAVPTLGWLMQPLWTPQLAFRPLSPVI